MAPTPEKPIRKRRTASETKRSSKPAVRAHSAKTRLDDGAAARDVSPRVARRERRRARSREEIVDAARRVLVREGLHGTTLEAVAREVGLTKAALYYYYPSKEAMLFEIVFGVLETQSHAVRGAVDRATDGGGAVRAVITETVRHFAGRLDDFRLVYLHGQVAGPDAMQIGTEQLARIRLLNDLVYGGATAKLEAGTKAKRGRANVPPRLLAFLASAAAVGVLTYKGMVESVGDPLRYSDDELVEGLCRVFEDAARSS